MGYKNITIKDYKATFKDDPQPHLLLDVRTTEEYAESHIPGAMNIPLNELAQRVSEVQRAAGTNPIVTVCKSGARSAMGARTLQAAGGVDTVIYNLEGGTRGWAKRHLPLNRISK